MNNVMIDIETMGQGNRAAVVAIGAVAFNKDGIQDTFYVNIDLEDAAKFGHIDASTVLWWMKQSNAAREELYTTENKIQTAEAMVRLHEFIASLENVKVWGNGATFDNVIIENLFDKLKISVPWKYWNDMCYRTVKNIFRDVKMERKGTHHNALDDAESQALHLIEIAKQKYFEL